MVKTALGIDIGGTTVKAGIVSSSGRIIEKKVLPHDVPSNPRLVVSRISSAVRSMDSWSRGYSLKKLSGIGIAVAGDTDPFKGTVRVAVNFGWKNAGIRDMFRREFRLPVMLDNDANAACWGSYCIELKRKIKNMLCVSLGTGVGGGIVTEGRLYRGTAGTAGEIGHMTVYPDGAECPCGNRGCLERYVGAYDIVREVRRRIRAGTKTVLSGWIRRKGIKLTPELVYRAAVRGDAFSRKLLLKAGGDIGTAVVSMVNILNPGAVVLCGGISSAGSYILGPVKKAVRERALPGASRGIKIFTSKLGGNLGLAGAACMAMYPTNEI